MQPSALELLSILPPSGEQLLSLLAVLAVAAGFKVIGAAMAGRGRLADADMLVGWAAVCALFTVAGRILPVSLSALAGLSALAVPAAVLVLWRRRDTVFDRGDWWGLVWMAPMLALTVSMQPSQWDEFGQWLPNARYLWLFDSFPAPGQPVSDSIFPAYPHATSLVLYLAGRLTGGFVDDAMPWFNLLLLACAGRTMVRLFRGDGKVGAVAAAWGLLGVTALSPTFVPKLVLSAYADVGTAVAVGFALVLGLRLTAGHDLLGVNRRAAMVQFAVLFALMPMIKQGNFALMGLLVLPLAVQAWRQGEKLTRWLPLMVGLMVPAVLVTLAWRLGVIPGAGELSIQPLSGWEWHLLPEMLESMAHVASSKGGYFGLGLTLSVAGLLALFRDWRAPWWPTARAFAVLFLGYNAFLVFVYLAILGGYESANAASYWRYNTHLGVAELFAAAPMVGALWRAWQPSRTVYRGLAGLGAFALVAGPFLAVKYIRFDRQPVKVHVRQVIAEIAPLLPPETQLVVVDPRGSGFYANYMEYHLGFGRQVVLSINVFSVLVPERLAPSPSRALWVHTQTPEISALIGQPLASNASHLLFPEGKGWRLVRSWPFPGYTDPAAVKD